MQGFSVSTSLTEKEYCQLFIKLSYRQRLYQIMTIMGVLLLVLSIVRFFTQSLISGKVQMFLFAFSVYCLVLFPVLVWWRARKIYRANKALQGTLKYDFDEKGISLDGGGIVSAFEWSNFGKTDKTRNFLLLFGYNRAAYFLKLKDMTPAQVKFIESKVEAQIASQEQVK